MDHVTAPRSAGRVNQFTASALISGSSRDLPSRWRPGDRGDRYGAAWVRERFEQEGVRYTPSELSKSELYRELLPALNSGRVRLLDDRRLLGQLAALERRTARGGRDSIDHGPRGHDDLANAAAGALHFARSGGVNPVRLWTVGDFFDPQDAAQRIRELVQAGGGAWFPEDGRR